MVAEKERTSRHPWRRLWRGFLHFFRFQLSRHQGLVPFLAIVAVHAVWGWFNRRPPAWDMAHHQLMGWRYLEAWRQGDWWSRFPFLSDYYPPLYYLQEAVILAIWPDTPQLALLANLTGLFLIGYASSRLARPLLGQKSSVWAGLLPLLFPLVAWVSRESLLDVALSGWVGAAVYLVWRSRFLVHKGWSLLFGLVVAAGMLTKWTFGLFLLGPLLWAGKVTPDRRRLAVNLFDAGLLALPLILWWYLPNLNALAERFSGTLEAAALEGDPSWRQAAGWIYYGRALVSYYLFLPFSLLLFWSMWRLARTLAQRRHRTPLLGLLLAWLVGGYLLLTLLGAKDPRYAMPLAAPLAILLLYPLRRKPYWCMSLTLLAFVQFLSISFAWTGPVKWALGGGDGEDYRSLSREWVLYQNHYFDVAGPPRREEWCLSELLEQLPAGSRVGFVPDLSHFHASALQLWGVRAGKVVKVERLGMQPFQPEQTRELHFVVGKTGRQGISYSTRYHSQVYRFLEEGRWAVSWTCHLPDGSQATLWRNPTPSRSSSRP